MKAVLIACGAAFTAAFLIPWHAPRGGQAVFAWGVMRHAGGWFERLWPPFLLAAAIVTLGIGLYGRGGRLLAGVALVVGAVGYLLWFVVKTPASLMMWDGSWRIFAFLIGVVAAPAGALRRSRAVATAGVVCLAAALLVPQRGHALLGLVVTALAHPQRLMWTETAALLWWLVLAVAGLAALTVWLPRGSRAIALGVAVVCIVWPAVLTAITGVAQALTFTPDVEVIVGHPISVLAPLVLAALGALVTLGAAEVT